MCPCAGMQKLMQALRYFPLVFSSQILKQKFTIFARVSEQSALTIWSWPSLSSESWDYQNVYHACTFFFFNECWGFKLRSSQLDSKSLATEVSSQAPEIFLFLLASFPRDIAQQLRAAFLKRTQVGIPALMWHLKHISNSSSRVSSVTSASLTSYTCGVKTDIQATKIK